LSLEGLGRGKLRCCLSFRLIFVDKEWGSFEIKNEILLKKLLIQYAKTDLTAKPELFNEFADGFQDLPLYLLKFFGSTDVDKIIDTMDFATYAYDIGHIVIDNLQFMLSGQAIGMNKFDLQDNVISKFRNFATEKNVHLTIVIHPKKIDDDMDLNIASVFGSAKATQEADNIFVLQNRHKYRLVDIRKNRFDGEVGRVGLGFDKETQLFFELTNQEISELRGNPDSTIKDVMKNRDGND
jgi:twinkle protein